MPANVSDLTILDLFNSIIHYKLWKAGDQSVLGYVKLANSSMPAGIKRTLISRKLEVSDTHTGDYKKALEYLKTQGSNYSGPKVVPDKLLSLDLIDSKGLASSLEQQVVTLSTNGVILLDFWASWCKRFDPRELKVIGVSLDTDANNNAWLVAFNKTGSSSDYINFRLADKNKRVFTSFFALTTIPRYVLVDKHGNILDFDFEAPSSSSFELNLRKYIKGWADIN